MTNLGFLGENVELAFLTWWRWWVFLLLLCLPLLGVLGGDGLVLADQLGVLSDVFVLGLKDMVHGLRLRLLPMLGLL